MTITFTDFKIQSDFFELTNNEYMEDIARYQEIMNKGDKRTIREERETTEILYKFAKEQYGEKKVRNKYNQVIDISLNTKDNFWINASNGNNFFGKLEVINCIINGEVNFDSSDSDYDWLEGLLSVIGVSGKYKYCCPYHDSDEYEDGIEGKCLIWENGKKQNLQFDY